MIKNEKTRVWEFWLCINVYVYKYVLSMFLLSVFFFYECASTVNYIDNLFKVLSICTKYKQLFGSYYPH